MSLLPTSNKREPIILASFSAFEEYIASRDARPRNNRWMPLVKDAPLYRGQADAAHPLQSTLDRNIKDCTIARYYNSILLAYFEITSVTEKRWDLPEGTTIRDACQIYDNKNKIRIPDHLPSADYLTYLRHYGFPSPLLDWSRSPYVAAFFAYRQPVNCCREHVSIFMLDNAFEEDAKPIVQTAQTVRVGQLGRHVITDGRHFVQQSDYTYCSKWEQNEWTFCSHEKLFDNPTARNIVLQKINLPASERAKVLRRLEQFNINAFSLFRSIEGLMETNSNRYFG